jgi:hypothetical protein
MQSDAVKLGRNAAIAFRRRRRIPGEHFSHRIGCRFCLESTAACSHLIQNRSKTEDVGAVVARQTARLLGRQVAHRAQQNAGLSLEGQGCALLGRMVATDQLGQSEIQDLGMPIAGDKDILRLQVAMNDAPLVSGSESARDLNAELNRPPERQALAREPLRRVSPSSNSDTM